MRAWGILRHQHAELLLLAREIGALVDENRATLDLTRVRLKLSTWVRKLRVHLTLEERLVYPRLVRDRDPSIAKKATEHQEELRGLREGLSRFSPSRLANGLADDDASAVELIEDARRTFAAAAAMFRVEEAELYGPLISMSSGHWSIAESIDEGDEDESAGRG
jgi:hypothetical protein